MSIDEDRPAHHRATGRGVLACGAGLVGITLGVGIGLPHLAKSGATPSAVVALGALVAGLTDTLEQAVVLAEHGYGVLMMDARGHGLSAGRAMDFGWYGDADLRAGVDFLTAQQEVDRARIGVVGLSMGAEEAIGAAAGDPRIRAVVAEGAGQRTSADKQWLSEVYGAAGTVQEQLDRITYTVTDLLTAAAPPITLRRAAELAAPRPLLLIAGGAVPDEEHAARWIHSGSPDSVTVWIVPEAGHIAGLSTAPEQWRERVTAFLDDALGAPGGGHVGLSARGLDGASR